MTSTGAESSSNDVDAADGNVSALAATALARRSGLGEFELAPQASSVDAVFGREAEAVDAAET